MEDANDVSYGIPSDQSVIKLKLKFRFFKERNRKLLK